MVNLARGAHKTCASHSGYYASAPNQRQPGENRFLANTGLFSFASSIRKMKMKTILQTLLLAAFMLAAGIEKLKAQATQTVRGRILDEVSKSPVIGASVILIRTEGPLIGATADLDGNFRMSAVPLGRQNFQVKAIGYESRMLSNVVITAGKEVVLEVVLTESVLQQSEVEITAKRSDNKLVTNNEMALISGRSFNLDDTKRYAGALGDPARMAANFAGVIAGNDSRNDIVVRGNSPAGMLWQMEGLNIPNPNHFGSLTSTGGPVSILNNNNLAKSDFLTSAFPAQYGNGLSGVFDLRLRNGNDEKREYLGQVGFNGFEIGAEGPFSTSNPKKGSYIFNYRYSTLGVFQKAGIEFGTGNAVPNYQDINFKIQLPLSQKVSLSAFGMGGLSDVKFLGNKVDTNETGLYGGENENIIVNYGAAVAGISLDIQASKNSNLKLTAGYAATLENFAGDSISILTRKEFPSGKALFTTGKYSFNGQFVHKLNVRNSIHAGFYNDFTRFNLLNKDIYQGTQEVIRVDKEGGNYLGQAYAQWKHRFSTRFSLTPGLHLQYSNQGNAFALEPRIGARYNLSENQSLNFGYGMHHQLQSVYTYAVETPGPSGIQLTNRNLGFTRSQHLVLGTERMISDNTSLKAEAYYQFIDRAPITADAIPDSYSALNTGNDFAPDEQDSLTNKGSGRNYGIELTLERSFTNGFYYLITASVFDSKYRGSDNIWRNTAFNTGYVLNVLAGKEWKLGRQGKNVFALNIKFSTIGGRYLTPLNAQASALAQRAIFEENRAFSERQAAYLRADVKLAYRLEYSKSTLEFAVDLQNVSNHQNVFNRQYNRRTNKIVTEYQQGFFPVPFVRYTF